MVSHLNYLILISVGRSALAEGRLAKAEVLMLVRLSMSLKNCRFNSSSMMTESPVGADFLP
jgi:hypothetical protein